MYVTRPKFPAVVEKHNLRIHNGKGHTVGKDATSRLVKPKIFDT